MAKQAQRPRSMLADRPSAGALRAVARPQADELRRDDEAIDSFFEVPAAVLCAYCGEGDCPGCAVAEEQGSGVIAIVPWERPGAGVWPRLWATARATTHGAEAFFSA